MSEMLPLSSFQSMGAVDGPSLRTVIFLYGCPLRCNYCHNPETWHGNEFTLTSVDELVQRVLRNKPYFNNGGGVTVSGGEPLLHQDKVISLFKELKAQGVHTCMDTSASESVSPELMDVTDLFLVDVKFLSGDEYVEYIKKDIFDSMVHFLDQTKEAKKPIWIRHVLYPGVTDSKEYVGRLLKFLEPYDQIERIDLLPFKSVCFTKYEKMGIQFPMSDVKESDLDLVKELKAMVPEELKGNN